METLSRRNCVVCISILRGKKKTQIIIDRSDVEVGYNAYFSRYAFVSALREMNETEEITSAPKDCGDSGSIWETGKKLFE